MDDDTGTDWAALADRLEVEAQTWDRGQTHTQNKENER